MTRYRGAPRPMSAALEALRDELAPETVLASVQRAWPGVVGEAIAAEARPISERGGVVTISCSAAVWAHELDLMAPMILGRLNGRIRGARIDRLRCVAV